MQDAIRNGQTTAAELLRGKGGQLPDGVGADEMCHAAVLGDLKKVQMLLSCGVDPDDGDYDSRTPMHLACSSARITTVSFLLGVDCTVNIRDRCVCVCM